MKAKRIRFYYSLFLSLFTLALGIAFIVQAVCIFAEGGWTNGAYSRELVAERLFPVSIVLYIWIAAIIVGFVLSLVYPQNIRKVNKVSEGVTLKRLSRRLPEGSGVEYNTDVYRTHRERRNRLIVYLVCAALCVICAKDSIAFVLNSSNFAGKGTNAAMLSMFTYVGPCVLIAFLGCIGMTLYEKYSKLREITVLKRLIASNKDNPVIAVNMPRNAAVVKVKAFFDNRYTKICIRAGIAAIAVTFILLGIFNEGARAVFIKAINICTECIGLG